MTLLILATSSAWAWDYDDPYATRMVHPVSAEPAPVDAVVVVTQVKEAWPPRILDPAGAAVPVKRLDHTDRAGVPYQVLVPEATLEPGRYTVLLDPSAEDTFTVEERAAHTVVPPVPTARRMGSDVQSGDPMYGSDTGVTSSWLYYYLCGDAAVYALAEGPAEPPAPELGVSGDFWIVDDSPSVSGYFDLGPGWTGTLWFGSFDEAGRFSGWTGPESVLMPPPQHWRSERMGAEPTHPLDCPEYGAWHVEEETFCPSFGGSECGELPEREGGCHTAGSGRAAGGLALVALAALRRRAASPLRHVGRRGDHGASRAPVRE